MDIDKVSLWEPENFVSFGHAVEVPAGKGLYTDHAEEGDSGPSE